MEPERHWSEAAQLVVAWRDHTQFVERDHAGDDEGLEKFIDVLEMLPALTPNDDPVESDLSLLRYLNAGLRLGFTSHQVLLDAMDATMQALSHRIAPPTP